MFKVILIFFFLYSLCTQAQMTQKISCDNQRVSALFSTDESSQNETHSYYEDHYLGLFGELSYFIKDLDKNTLLIGLSGEFEESLLEFNLNVLEPPNKIFTAKYYSYLEDSPPSQRPFNVSCESKLLNF